MRSYSLDDIRQTFSTSTDFNEIFDVFQAALHQKIKDVEPYRLLFWNQSLTPDEIRLFGEKLADVSDVAKDLAARYGGYYPAAEEACKVNNVWKSLPRFFASHAINYRTDVFQQAGAKEPPKTWEELYTLGKAIKAANLPPVAFPLGHAVGDVRVGR